MSRRGAAALLVLWASVLVLALLGPDRARLVPALGAWTAAFLALGHLWRRHGALLDDPRVLLGGAVLLRLTLLPALPDLSDDLYRYVWDGWLLVSGVSPYRFVPADPALAAFQVDPLFSLLNSPDYRSVYPPLSQLVFAPAGLAYAWWGWPAAAYVAKAGFLLMETAGVGLLYAALLRVGRAPRHLALYAWNPLALIAVAGGGHSEGGLVLGMGLLAFGMAGARPRTAWVGLVLAGLSKAIPLLLAPLLLRRHLARLGARGTARAAAPGLVLGLALALPFVPGGMIEAGLRSGELYVRLFEFNAGLYFLVRELAFRITGQDLGRTLGPLFGLLFLGGAAAVWLRWHVHRVEGWAAGCLLVVGLYLATATTVHPWYLLLGLVLVPLARFTRSAWMWASWAAFPTYLTYTGVPHAPLAGLFWGGVALCLLGEGWPALRSRLLPLAGRRKARQIREHVVGRTVLDLGAGEGWVGEHLRSRGRGGDRRVILADPEPAFRAALPAVVCRGEELPLRDDSVDTVVLSLVLHHTSEPDRVLGEALRVAARRVVITESVYRREWGRHLLERIDRAVNRARGAWADPDPEPLRFRPAGEWEEAVRGLGGEVRVSRRLNRIGHRHHLFVVEPGDRAPS